MTVVGLGPGARIWFEGDIWVIDELGPKQAMIRCGTRFRAVALGALVSAARVVGESDEDVVEAEPVNVVLAALTPAQRAKVEHRVQVVLTLLADDGRPMQERLPEVAQAEGTSVRTLERWLQGYRAAGPAGLVNSRVLQHRATAVDPRWDAACLAVLREFVSSSTPTMNVVIDRIRRRVEEEHGPGVVVCPPRTTAYRRLGELSKGRHAFGSGKARRSVANRPGGPYGRLRATRPGEYVVLDTTPLDVFAMEPVTLRWVPVELTIAQDLFTRCVLGMRLSPVSTRSADVANVLYQCVTPQLSGADDGRPWPPPDTRPLPGRCSTRCSSTRHHQTAAHQERLASTSAPTGTAGTTRSTA